jgi:hypothetical protein
VPDLELRRISEVVSRIEELYASGNWDEMEMKGLIEEVLSHQRLHPLEVSQAYARILAGWLQSLLARYRNVVSIDVGRKGKGEYPGTFRIGNKS